MWVSKRRLQEIEKRLTDIEAQINRWQAHDPEETEKIMKNIITRFQSPSGAIRGSVPESS